MPSHFAVGLWTASLLVSAAWPQTKPADEPASGSNWSLHFQATSIGQWHGSFQSLYQGENSLPAHPEKRVSLTSTLFLTRRLTRHMEIVVDPEIAGGKGFGEVTGIAGFTNGEIPRVSSATPTPYVARAFLRTSWALGSETENVDNAVHQLAGAMPVRRFTVITGKFSVTDYFDNNTYSHDPRSQFMNWAIMYNGAWDYPADVRGYTVGALSELTERRWSLRAASVMEPTVANGPTLDTRVARNRGEVIEWEGRYKPRGRTGAFRALAFANRERAGTYREAISGAAIADLGPARRPGTLKYGFGLNLEQSLTPEIGVFSRYGWSDGKTESWAFTEIDRTISGGLALDGKLWKRAKDRIGIAGARNYLSGDHRSFLAAGGMGFILGDGRLNYGPESIVEAYYSWSLTNWFTVTGDFQHVWNPAYNRDRGPVPVASIRLHLER